MADLRKMTMGEICEIAGLPKETARARLKGLGWLSGKKGWERFDLPSAVRFIAHAELFRQTGNPQVSIETANFIADGIYNIATTPPYFIRRKGELDGWFLTFRPRDGLWHMKHHSTRDAALQAVGENIAESMEFIEASNFQFVNPGILADWALGRIFDFQWIDGNQAQVIL